MVQGYCPGIEKELGGRGEGERQEGRTTTGQSTIVVFYHLGIFNWNSLESFFSQLQLHKTLPQYVYSPSHTRAGTTS